MPFMNKALILGFLSFLINTCALPAQQAHDRGDAAELAPPALTFTTLVNFGGSNGSNPFAGLVQGFDGNFYWTTYYGGANNSGTVFKITPAGTLITLYRFCAQSGCTDGTHPSVQGTDGNFYGTTIYGGGNDGFGYCFDYGCGTVFKITPAGAMTKLYSFCASQTDCSDGALPDAGLVQSTDRNLYGTTSAGGATAARGGTVFKITPTGKRTTLYSFCAQSSCTDGYSPVDLVQATDGNFYGTAFYGGANNFGTVFKIAPSGSLTTLYSLDLSNGATLVQATGGAFYGTTTYGGTSNDGTVFTLSVGLGPFVETQPASGKVGAGVKILGTNLTGATSVTFNGTAAAFTVVSPSLITTTVPAGATTGEVKVIKPHGTVQSNVPFRVAH